jgi:type III restriction enzyme
LGRERVNQWRNLPDPARWQVTPETARLLHYWRQHTFQGVRPFFCQIEAVETAIWLAEVAPQQGQRHADLLSHLRRANDQANPDLYRIALKLATGAGKTTVMAMLIAWQTVNAVRHPQSRRFTRGFLSWRRSPAASAPPVSHCDADRKNTRHTPLPPHARQ